MKNLRDVFERDPTRRISRVVKISEHRDQWVGPEVEEYVVTEQIQRLIQDFIDQFLETRMGRVQDVCSWISGFFGSGKSHLAKMLGYVLASREVTFRDGTEVDVADYFRKKHGVRGTSILTKELKTKAFFYNALKFERAKGEDLCRFIYRSISKDLGFSEVLWLAEIERTLQEEQLWEKFNKVVEEETDKPWHKVRENRINMRPVLIKALTKVKPEIYPDIEMAREAVEDQRREFLLDTERLAERLYREALDIDEEKGRILLILDEVYLYLKSAGASGLTELDSLAEQLEKEGKGKVWLIATGQEALEYVAPELGARGEQVGWLQDRFPLKYKLLPENIPIVVNRRLLEKNQRDPAYRELENLYDKYSGRLAEAAAIQGAARDKEIFSKFEFEHVSESYPLLPYHIDLMLEIFGMLRSKGRMIGQETRLAGRERAVLSVVQSIINELINRGSQVGVLVTFDLLYDAIEEVLKVVSSDVHHLVSERILELGELEGLPASSVAKALFLLQQVKEWVPATSNNIAAVLYPRIGEDPTSHRGKVEKCLDSLIDHNWVREEEGRYRFLSEAERNFEDDIDREIHRIRISDLGEKAVEVASEALKNLKKYSHRGVKIFKVNLSVDGEEIGRGGHLNLNVYTPHWSSRREEPVEDLSLKSLGDENTVYWVGEAEEGFSYKLRRALSVGKVLDEWTRRARTPQELGELEPYRREIAAIEDELPKILESSLRSGTILFFGEREELDRKKTLQETFKNWMRRLTEELFTRFDEGAVKVEKDNVISSVLNWRGGKLPSVYREAKLVDKQHQNLLTNGPVAYPILREIKNKGEMTGREIEEHFGSPKFGWPERLIRLAMATLYQKGSIQAEPAEQSSFIKSRSFRSARFSVGIALTNEEKLKAKRLISKIFAVDAGITTQQISQTIASKAEEKLQAIQDLEIKQGYHALPYNTEMSNLKVAFQKLLAETIPQTRVKTFLDPEILEALETQMPLLDDLKDWMDGDGLNLYLTMRRFADTPLTDLVRLEPRIESDAANLMERLTAKSLLNEWGSIYDQFRKLKEQYKLRYLEAHDNCQIAVEEAAGELEKWAGQREIEKEEVEKVIRNLKFLNCTGGKETAYDEKKFLCDFCGRTLSTIQKNKRLVQLRLREAKEELIKYLAEKGEGKPSYDEKISSTKHIGNSLDLEKALGEAREFVQFWIAQRKRVKLKIQGETESG